MCTAEPHSHRSNVDSTWQFDKPTRRYRPEPGLPDATLHEKAGAGSLKEAPVKSHDGKKDTGLVNAGGNPRTLTRLQRRADALEARVRNLVDMLGDGQRSPALTQALQQAEAELALHRAEIGKILIDDKHPARVASQDEVDRKLDELERQFSSSPASARETLHQLFGRRAIELRRSRDGHYRAVAILFPDVFLVERANAQPTTTKTAWSTSHQIVWRKRVEVPFDCDLG